MLITQRKAIAEIRSRTGLSEASATEKVKAMPKIADGRREKVTRYSVELVVAEVEKPPKPVNTVSSIRPFSAKKIAAIRAYGLPPRQRA